MTKEEKAENLRAWLVSSGLSQTAFAREIHSSVRTVQDWVGEKREIQDFVYFLIGFWFEHRKVDSLKER